MITIILNYDNSRNHTENFHLPPISVLWFNLSAPVAPFAAAAGSSKNPLYTTCSKPNTVSDRLVEKLEQQILFIK